MDEYEPTPAARLIEQHRTKSKVSVRKAAQAAGLSEGRWRQIAKGYQQAARGIRVPVNTPDETLARMATAVGVCRGALVDIGAEGVAAAMTRSEARTDGLGLVLHTPKYEAALQLIDAWLGDADADGPIHPPTEALWLWSPLQLSLGLAGQVEMLEQAFQEVDRDRFRLMKESESDGDTAATTQAGGSPVFSEASGEDLEPDQASPDLPAQQGRRKSPPPAQG